MLEGNFSQIWLTGEISNFTQPVSGHWYLTLKDENAQVRCAMFRMKNLRVAFRPQNGMQVLVRANVSLYEPRGDYQLIIDSMHPAGEGLLQQQFEALKMKLAAEGLFSQNLKKNLPHFSKAVGIIIYPTAVQGKEATAEIVQMIELANLRQEVDVLIVGRGGGSLEDLWCFNEEEVARAIFRSTLPIISAVGHETDVTIADFVADLRAPTPSAAAELVSRNQDELLQQLRHQQQRLDMAFDRLFTRKSQRLKQLTLRLQNQHPQNQLRTQQAKNEQLTHRLQLAMLRQFENTQQKFTALSSRLKQNPLPYRVQRHQQRLEQLQVRLNFFVNRQVTERQNKLATLCGKLDGLSPLKVLARGYSIAENAQGKAIISTQDVKKGECITTQVKDGRIISKVI